MKTFCRFILAATLLVASLGRTTAADAYTPDKASPYYFDGTISREVLENYLDRSVTMQSLLIERGASFDDNLRMIENMGIKFVGRAVCQWAGEGNMLANFELERRLIPRIHAIDPEIILQACIFEIVSENVNSVPVPAWCFELMGMPVEKRNFSYKKMLYPDGQFVGHWNKTSSVPDVSQPETQLYFLYQAAAYIDMGIEAIHFGQVELMNKNDRQLHHYAGVLAKIRAYAKDHARRGMIICDAHVPGGGFLYDGDYLLMDFHSFPLRIKEESTPQQASLEVGYTDALYHRSKGGRTYSGWTCETLPYLVEFDNYGGSGRPNQPRTEKGGFIWIWGYDEISWFANQPDDYRHEWLRYAYDWVGKTDPNGWLQMPAGRQTTGIEGRRWYSANDKSAAAPDGMGDEDTIRDIWKNGRTSTRTAYFRVAQSPADLRGDMVLWYRQPAAEWLDAMPVGNGRIAGMVFGETVSERIALNESSFWSGRPHDYDDPEAGKHFDYIRDQVFAGNYQNTDKYIDENFYGKPVAQQAYQPLGDLLLHFPDVDASAVENYRRDLDMETGITTVSYKSGDVTYLREVFVSHPDNVMVVRVSADKPGALDVQAELKSFFTRKITATPGGITLDGTWSKPDVPANSWNWLIAPVEGDGMSFQTVLEAKTDGGTSQGSKDGKLNISGANSVTFVLTASTSHVGYNDISGNPAAKNAAVMAAASKKDFAALKKSHTADFAGLMSRVHLTIGDPAAGAKPTDVRLAAMRNGTTDTNMEALIFQFGRYSLASASRAGGQASNLQGIWNEELLPPWGSKYTININIQMNYWPAEVTNLAETAQPLFDMIEETSHTGAKTAKVYYGVDEGWVCHHNLDIWRGAAPVDGARFGMWPVGGAWLTRHIWEHYEYGRDIEFLKKYYPVLKGSAQFLSGVLTEHPDTGYLVTPFSMSPEHGFLYGTVNTPGDKLAYVSPAPTMDVAIINDLFSHVIEASRILGVDTDFAAHLTDQLTKIPPYKVNSKGTVQEWLYDFGSGAQGHNLSTNYPLFPGNSMLLHRESDGKLIAAQNKWLDGRAPRGGGFPSRWDMALWARMERGDKVAEFISAYSQGGVANNLHHASKSNQIDATAGHTAAIAEALIQSHAGEISLLPALPVSWPDGSVSGLRARGGYEVSMSWTGGKLVSAEIINRKGGTTAVRSGGVTREITLAPGEVTKLIF